MSADSTWDPVPIATGGRRPLVALALSALLPGLGQIYNRQLLSGIGLAGVTALLFHLAFTDPRIAGFVGAVWLYQAVEAWSAASTSGSIGATPAGSPPSRWWSFGLIGAGALLLVETNTGAILPRTPLLFPLLLILVGARLLYTYHKCTDGQQ